MRWVHLPKKTKKKTSKKAATECARLGDARYWSKRSLKVDVT